MKTYYASYVELGERYSISAKPFGYPKDISESCKGFQKDLFRMSKRVLYFCMLYLRNISDLSSQGFGYHISGVVSDIENLFGFVMTLCLLSSI